MLLIVPEIFAYGAAGVWRDIEQGRRVRGRGRNHDGVFHGSVFGQGVYDAGDSGRLLPDSHIDANHVLLFLVDDGINGDSGFTGLAVADDKFTLAPADRYHGINGQPAGLERFLDGLALDDIGRTAFDRPVFSGGNRAPVVQGLAQGIDHPADERRSDRHLGNPSGGPDLVAFFNLAVIAQHHAANMVFLQVERHAENRVNRFPACCSGYEFNQFRGHNLV